MDENQIDQICLSDPSIQPYYFGSIASDEYPEKWPSVGMYILNSQSRSMAGEHWSALALSMTQSNRCDYVDSFARPPPDALKNSLLNQGWKIVWNDVTLQHFLTQSCGKISLLFLKLWSAGYETSEIVQEYLFNTPSNDPFKNEAFSEHLISLISPVERGRIVSSVNIR